MDHLPVAEPQEDFDKCFGVGDPQFEFFARLELAGRARPLESEPRIDRTVVLEAAKRGKILSPSMLSPPGLSWLVSFVDYCQVLFNN